MTLEQAVIVDITDVSKSDLASLHLRYLPTRFSGRAGVKLLELYYEALSGDENSFGFAAIFNNKTVGFSCAVSSANNIQKRLLMRFPFEVCYWALHQIISRPQVLGNLARRIFCPKYSQKSGRWIPLANLDGWYTYRPVVVDEPYRKYRIADLLTEKLLDEAKKRQIPGILAVVAHSNFSSLRHFRRNTFLEIWNGEDFTVLGKVLEASKDEPGKIQI